MTQANPLAALSPLDGRYQNQLVDLAQLFSEFGLIKNRLIAEVRYFIFLSEQNITPQLSTPQKSALEKILETFDLAEAEKVKDFEKTTKHDVKAVEYYLREKLSELGITGEEWVHFGLTSEDVNSVAYAMSLKEANQKIILPRLQLLQNQIVLMIEQYRAVPMLARTHGQPAVATTVGKELLVFAMRLQPILEQLSQVLFEAKLSGAVGNFNAHFVAFENTDWLKFSQDFLKSLGLSANLFTTQIISSETYISYFQLLQRANGVLLDLSQDMWRYISDGYFVQSVEKGQVGSSTMPQKINPIDFENCEGNLGLANALFAHFIQKLAVSRLQRDLSDSTVKRSFGTALAHSELAYKSCLKGLKKITANETKLKSELNQHWEVVTEGIQTILRTAGDQNAYEKVKTFSQGQLVTAESVALFIEGLEVDDSVKQKLSQLTPETYLGAVQQIIDLGLYQLKRSTDVSSKK